MASKTFRIAIDARPFASPACGFTVYLESILKCLQAGPFDVTLVGNIPFLSQHHAAAGLRTDHFGSASQFVWEQRDLPRYLASGGYDLYFSGANRGIPLRKSKGTRYLLGLLDVIPYLFFSDYFLRRWRTLLMRPQTNSEMAAQLIAIARADAILTISAQSARDIRRLFHRGNVANHLIRLRDGEVAGSAIPLPQFVYVGGVDARKQVNILLHGFASFDAMHPGHRLILIGGNYGAVAEKIGTLGLADKVVVTGFIDHDHKDQIIAESLAMVYPSLYEGYGMAIAEGFQAGIPVIAGAGGSQEEVGGAGVRRIDPTSPASIATAMAEMLDPASRATWIARGQVQLRHLTDPAIEVGTLHWFTDQARLARES